MMTRFEFLRTPKVMFGMGQAQALPEISGNRHSSILLITGLSSHRLNPHTAKLIAGLDQNCNAMFESIGNEPSPSDIDRITGKYRNEVIDAVIAIGGGSVLDAGKAVSAMMPVNGTVRDYLEGVGTLKHNGQKKYFVAVPTTAGTGSEATSNAVLSETGSNGFKRSIRHENFIPDLAVIDPLLTVECPPEITASSGMDAFTQLLESFLSVKASPLTDVLALEGIQNIHLWLEMAVSNGNNIEARSGMSYAAFLSGISLSNAGLGLIHGFASSVGGLINVPHGLVCGTMMGVVNRFNVEELLKQTETTIAHMKYTEIGKLLSGEHNKSNQWFMQFVADYIEDLCEKFHLKRLGAFGLTEPDLERIASVTDHKANPVKFEKQQLVEMLKIRI